MAFVDCGAGKYKSSLEGDVLSGTFFVEWIEWLNKSAIAGDDLLVVDDGDNDIQAGVADATNFQQLYPVLGYYTDPTLSVLDRGTVYIQTTKNPANN